MLFIGDISLFLLLLSLHFSSPHLLCCFLGYHSPWQLVLSGAASLEETGVEPGWVLMLSSASRTQRGCSSSVFPNKISKAPYENTSNRASDKRFSVYLLGQWKIPNSHNLFQSVSLFQSHFGGTRFNSVGMQEDGDFCFHT